MATPLDSYLGQGTTDEYNEDNSSPRPTVAVDSGSRHGTSDEYLDPWCDPCENEGKYVRVISYCPKCIEFFCQHCDRSHSKFQITKSHVVQRGSDMPSCQADKPPKYEECRLHDGKFKEYMCTTHKIMICQVCQKDHEHCDVKHATEMCKLVESSHVDELVNEVQSLYNDAVTTKKSIEGNVADIERHRKGMLQRAQAKYEEMVSKCSQQLKEATNHIDKQCKSNTSTLSQHLKDMSVATTQLDLILQQIQAVDRSKLDTKSFLKLQTLAENTKQQMIALNDMTKTFKYIETDFTLSEQLASLLSRSVRMGTVQDIVSPCKHVLPQREIAFPFTSADAVSSRKGNDTTEPDFPVEKLAVLDEMINRERWTVPVHPGGELEVLLDAAIKLCKEGRDTKSEPCQRFFREGLITSFTKIFTDEAIGLWKVEIHNCIFKSAEKLVELCVLKLSQDCFRMLGLLAIVFSPDCKFHTVNVARPSTSVPTGRIGPPGLEVFARSPDLTNQRGWLVDLVNKFGQLGGFQILLDRFTGGSPLSVPVIAAFVKPFGQCAEVLTQQTGQKYMMPVIDVVLKFLDRLPNEEVKKESKKKEYSDFFSIIKSVKHLIIILPNPDKIIKALERLLERKMKLN